MNTVDTTHFTPRLHQVLALGGKESVRLNHDVTGAGHLFIGLLILDQGVAIHSLRRMKVDLGQLRSMIENTIDDAYDDRTDESTVLTLRAKGMLETARNESTALKHTYVGTEHFVLALLSEPDYWLTQLLAEAGIERDRFREEVLKELDPGQFA